MRHHGRRLRTSDQDATVQGETGRDVSKAPTPAVAPATPPDSKATARAKRKTLTLEVNGAHVKDAAPLRTPAGGVIMITPALDEDFWWARVPLGVDQAIVCFPKFGTIGVGFQREEDWNTNLPYTSPAVEIYDHIKHNRGKCRADRATCIRAIEMVQEWATAKKAEGRG